MRGKLTRRGFCAGVGAAIPGCAIAADATQAILASPPSVVGNPPRQWGPGAPPEAFPDPDVLLLDKSFRPFLIGLDAIHRIGTGFQWAEGPAWSSEGQYAVFSDVKGDTQYRYIWELGKFTTFRKPSYNSNGNSFDFQGRQISTQDYNRRVIRWENDGSMTVIADSFEGQSLNSPNDLVAHPDGSIWFTDPYFGGLLSEGHPDVAGGRSNPNGYFDPLLGAPGSGLIGGMKQVLPAQTYRWDPSGRLSVVINAEQAGSPNGICFSPDYKRVYLINGGRVMVGDVSGSTVSGLRLFTDCMIDGVHCGPDGMRADKAGNLWVSSNAPLGYCGVTVWNLQGKAIGRIRLPEVCANLCFAGPKRDYLFMTASQSVYMLRLNIQGAAPG